MSQYRINSICQGTINIMNCAEVDASLITKQVAVKKEMGICFNIKVARTKCIQSILKTIFEFALTQMTQTKAQPCEVFDSFAVVTIKGTVWRWSSKLSQILFENSKTSVTSKIRIQLVQSITIDGKKKEFLKKLCLVRNRVTSSVFLLL